MKRVASAKSEFAATDAPSSPPISRQAWILGAVLLAAGLWTYWPTMRDLADAWDRVPDYSHGYLVPLLSVWFLWTRRDLMPDLTERGKFVWVGMGALVVIASIGTRLYGARFYLSALEGWSIVLWLSGGVLMVTSWRTLVWSLPSIVFLFFMVPLPYRVEHGLSGPLQRIATKLSCWGLQCLGFPAIAEGNTIHLSGTQLEVAQACSGLRIFMGILALAFAYIVLARRTWWESALLLLSAVPVALIANSIRIIATGIAYQYATRETAKKLAHDGAGWFTILIAAGLFGLVLWYMSRLLREEEEIEVGELVRVERG